MNAVIFARTSSAAPNPHLIDDQIAFCRARCEREGWVVVGIFVDHPSGVSSGQNKDIRTGLSAMLAHVEAGGVDRVITETTDRLARSQGEAYAIQQRITVAGALLVTAAEGDATDITVAIPGLLDSAFRRDRTQSIRRGNRLAGAVSFGRSGA